MDISIFICAILVFACSIGGIVGVIVALRWVAQDTNSKWFKFCALCTFVCVAIVLLVLMIGSIVAISEQLGFYSHSQVMSLYDLVYLPVRIIIFIGIIFSGIDLVNVHFEL